MACTIAENEPLIFKVCHAKENALKIKLALTLRYLAGIYAMVGSVVSAIHYVLPPGKLSNQDLYERFGERQVAAAAKMSEIDCRRIVTPGICASDLAYAAADRLLYEREIDRKSIDFIIMMTETPDYMAPATACTLQHRLGLSNRCGAFDINLGCSAFPYGLSVCHGLVASGVAKKILLLVADALTPLIHPQDRALVALHGDGGSAAIVEACDPEFGYFPLVHGTDGSCFQHLIIPASGARNPRTSDTRKEIVDSSGCVTTAEHLHMNGPAVFHFVLNHIPKAIHEALDRAKLTVTDVDMFLFHQANKGMIDLVYKALHVPEQKRFYFFKDIGNCGAASTPIVLAEAWRQGVVRPGSRTLIASFGIGISWAVGLFKWPEQGDAAVTSSTEFHL